MKTFLSLSILIMAVFCYAPGAVAQSALTRYHQEDLLRVAPDESAAFVPILKPPGGMPTVEVIARQGEWEEVRLHYRFKYNGSTDPNICMMSLFEGTFTGFRKITAK